MLVLSRKAGEKITIGEGITVVVSRISGGRVTLAIEAPENVRILRGELAPQAGKTVAVSEPVPTTGATLSNAKTVTGPAVPQNPRSATLPSSVARRTMLSNVPATITSPQTAK